MTRTFDGPDYDPGDGPGMDPATPPATPRSTWGERAIVLGGFAAAALWTAVSAATGAGMETVGAVWLAAVGWTVPASLALALRRGLRDRDWSAFRGNALPDNSDVVDWSTRTGAYAYMRRAEEQQRQMRRN